MPKTDLDLCRDLRYAGLDPMGYYVGRNMRRRTMAPNGDSSQNCVRLRVLGPCTTAQHV